MANYIGHAELESLAQNATVLLDDDSSGYDGYSDYRTAKATSPWQKGTIVFADLDGLDNPPRRVLVHGVKLDRPTTGLYAYEYVNHAYGFVEKKDGSGWARMYRHITRGDITRGYEKARKLGLVPTAVEA